MNWYDYPWFKPAIDYKYCPKCKKEDYETIGNLGLSMGSDQLCKCNNCDTLFYIFH
jgi:hypothetical protein